MGQPKFKSCQDLSGETKRLRESRYVSGRRAPFPIILRELTLPIGGKLRIPNAGKLRGSRAGWGARGEVRSMQVAGAGAQMQLRHQ